MEPQEYHTLRAVEDTHWWFRSLHELVCSSLIRACGKNTLRIFEAGCGTGGLAAKLRDLGTVEGVDIAPLAIEHCRARGLAGMRVGDLNSLDLPEHTYDAIVSIDVLYHRGITDPALVLRKFLAGLKPGGVLFLHLPAYEFLRSDHDRRVHTGRRFRLRAVERMLRDAGFAVEHGSYRLTSLFLPTLLLRLCQRLRGHLLEGKQDGPSALERSHMGGNALLALCRAENAVSRYIRLPFGISLYAIARGPPCAQCASWGRSNIDRMLHLPETPLHV